MSNPHTLAKTLQGRLRARVNATVNVEWWAGDDLFQVGFHNLDRDGMSLIFEVPLADTDNPGETMAAAEYRALDLAKKLGWVK